MGPDAANDLVTPWIVGIARFEPGADLDDGPGLRAIGGLAAALLDLADLGVDDVEVVDAALLRALEEDDELGPPLGVLEDEGLDRALLVAQGGEGVEYAVLEPALLGNNALHGEPRPIALDALSCKPGHIAILPMDGEHDGGGRGDVGLVPHPESVLLQTVKDPPDDLEEDEELIDRPLALLQRSKKEVEHILAEAVVLLHPGLTPFSLSRRRPPG